MDQQLIFPFERPLDYYKAKEPTQLKGRMVEYCSERFAKVLKSVGDRKSFKLACLRNRYPLEENTHIQVGVQSVLQGDHLRLMLYIGNKGSREIVSLRVQY